MARLTMLAAAFGAIFVPVFAFCIRGPGASETWIVATAGLAVIASVISSWSSRRAVEMQEDSQNPVIYPIFDISSLNGMFLITIKNDGGSPAYDISLEWETDLPLRHGESVGFKKKDGGPAILQLHPGQHISQFVGSHIDFLQSHADHEYQGCVTFKDRWDRSRSVKFRLDGRNFEGTPLYQNEAQKMHQELQKVPKELEEIAKALKTISVAAAPKKLRRKNKSVD